MSIANPFSIKKIKGNSDSKGKSERQIEDEICYFLTNRDILFWKIKIKGDPILTKKGFRLKKNPNVGFSDILLCFKGKLICLEVKKNGGICSFDQLSTQLLVRNHGGIYEFVTSVSEVKKIIDGDIG